MLEFIYSMIEFIFIRFVDIRCAPEEVEEVTALLAGQGIQFSVMIEDVQKLAELVPMKKGSKSK